MIDRWFLGGINFGLLDNDWYLFNGESWIHIKDVFTGWTEFKIEWNPQQGLWQHE